MLFHFFAPGPVVYPALDAIGIMGYTVFFIAVTLLTMRRPAYGACVLTFCVPFALYQRVFGETITLPKVALVAVLLGLSTHANAFAPLSGRTARRILIAGVLVLCATLLSFIAAIHHGPVIREALKMVEYVLIFCAAAASYRLDPDRTAFARALMLSAIAAAILALAQEIVGAPSVLLVNGHTLPRIAGPLEGPNQLAGFFDILLPAALVFAVRDASRLARGTLALIVFADILTFSRGGFLGAATALVAVGYGVRWKFRNAWVPLVCGISAGVGALFSWGVVADSLGVVRLWTYDSAYAGGVGTRPELWNAALTLWKQHPVFGVGAGNFQLDIPLTGLRGVRTHANSLYLQSLVEGGIPLISATLWLVYTSITAFAGQSAEDAPFAVAALGASAALAVHQIFDFLTFYPKVGAEWWIVMALGAVEIAAAVGARRAACAPAS